MIIVIPTDTTHIIDLIPRYTPDDSITLNLYNEATQVFTDVVNTFTFLNGILQITFDFTFVEGDNYQLKLTDINGVVFRGKIYTTLQATQDFKATKDKFNYA